MYSPVFVILLVLQLILSKNERTSCRQLIHLLPKYSCFQNEPLDHGARGTIFIIQSLATKYILKAQTKDSQSLNELQILRRLRGAPHVVQLHDSLLTDDLALFVQGYAPNGNMRQFIVGNDAFSFDFTVGFFRKLLAGVRAMHQAGIVHADLKPENVVVDAQFDPVIIDFDLSVDLDSRHRPRGTLDCMAPEVLRRFGTKTQTRYTEEIDLYSVGVMFYEFFLDRQPYHLDALDYNALLETRIYFERGIPEDFFLFVSLTMVPASHRASFSEAVWFLDRVDLDAEPPLTANVSYKMISFAGEGEGLLRGARPSALVILLLIAAAMLLFGLASGFCFWRNSACKGKQAISLVETVEDAVKTNTDTNLRSASV